MPVSKFESMLKTDNVYYFDVNDIEMIVLSYIDSGRLNLAKKALDFGKRQHVNSPSLLLLEVQVLVAQDKNSLAIGVLEQFQGIYPKDKKISIQKAEILSKAGDHKSAINELESAIDLESDSLELRYKLAMEYLYVNDFKKARLNFVHSLETSTFDHHSLNNIVYCFNMEENYQGAILFLERVLSKDPYCELTWHQLGRQFMHVGEYEKAIEAFDFAIAIDEIFVGAYTCKASCLYKIGKYEDAIALYLLTTDLDDPTSCTYCSIALCFLELHIYDSAVFYFNKAVHEDPSNKKAWLYLIEFYVNQQKNEDALACVKEALYVDDTNIQFWLKFAEISEDSSSYSDAAKGYYQIIRLGVETLDVFVSLLDILFRLGEFSSASSVLEDAMLKYKNSAVLEYRLSVLSLMQNNIDEGLVHFKKALRLDSEGYTVVGELFPDILSRKDVSFLISSR